MGGGAVRNFCPLLNKIPSDNPYLKLLELSQLLDLLIDLLIFFLFKKKCNLG